MGEILFPTILQSNAIMGGGANLTSCRVTITYSGGSLLFYLGVSSSCTVAPTSWEEVTVTTGVAATHTFTGTGNWLYYMVLKEPDTIISTTLNTYGRISSPAIIIDNIV